MQLSCVNQQIRSSAFRSLFETPFDVDLRTLKITTPIKDGQQAKRMLTYSSAIHTTPFYTLNLTQSRVFGARCARAT